MNAYGQSTSLVYGNPASDARLGHIMIRLSSIRMVSPTMDMQGEIITAIRLSREQTRWVFRAEVSIHGGWMCIRGVDRLVSRGFT
jgi:hypothetical protein